MVISPSFDNDFDVYFWMCGLEVDICFLGQVKDLDQPLGVLVGVDFFSLTNICG